MLIGSYDSSLTLRLVIRDVKKKALSERVVAIYPADRRPEFRDFDVDADSHRRLSTNLLVRRAVINCSCTAWISVDAQQDDAMAGNFGRILRSAPLLFGMAPQIANA
jgi:hypothetical protein